MQKGLSYFKTRLTSCSLLTAKSGNGTRSETDIYYTCLPEFSLSQLGKPGSLTRLQVFSVLDSVANHPEKFACDF